MLELIKRLLSLFQNPPAIKNPPKPIEKSKIMNNNITLEELNSHQYPTTPNIDANLLILWEKINKVRDLYGKPMIVTSGLRSQSQQEQLIKDGKSNAPKSNHLIGAAVDILDNDGSLNQWTKDNEDKIVEIGLWMENRQGNWQHYQIFTPKSGNRWFNP